jgi:hypothetical protein
VMKNESISEPIINVKQNKKQRKNTKSYYLFIFV